MASGPNTKVSMDALFKDTLTRITLLERRLAIAGGGGGGGTYQAMPGLISPFGGGAVPSGWLLCDGSSVLRSSYPELFATIGTTWGSASSTTFNLPDLRGRVVVGRDISQTEFDTLAEVGGSKVHSGEVVTYGASGTAYYASIATGNQPNSYSAGVHKLPAVPSFTAPNMPPYTVANWIISTGSGVGGGGTNVPALPAPVSVYATAGLTIPGAAAIWNDVPGVTWTVTLPQPLWVEVEFGSQYSTTSVSNYAMIGVAATGALNLAPEVDQVTAGTNRFELTPFGLAPNTRLQGSKVLLLPAGTTTLKVQARKAATDGTQTVTYANMIVMPMQWVGAPTVNSMTRGTTAERNAVYGVPATDAARVALANQQVKWFNTELGYEESYYATTGLTGLTARGLIAGYASGWYPTTAGAIYAHRGKTNGFQGGVGTTPTEVVLAASQIKRGPVNDEGSGGLRLVVGGIYKITGRVYFSGGGAMAYVAASIRANGSGLLDSNGPAGAADVVQTGVVQYPCANNTLIALWGYSAAAQNFYGASGYNGSFLEVEYLGPPLTNG